LHIIIFSAPSVIVNYLNFMMGIKPIFALILLLCKIKKAEQSKFDGPAFFENLSY